METGGPPPAPPPGPRCTGWWHLDGEKKKKTRDEQISLRLCWNEFLDRCSRWRKTSRLSPIGSIQMPSSEGLRGTVRPSVLASMVTGSWWMARASRDAAVLSPSSTEASSLAVSSCVPHTVTVTLSPGDTATLRLIYATTNSFKYLHSAKRGMFKYLDSDTLIVLLIIQAITLDER